MQPIWVNSLEDIDREMVINRRMLDQMLRQGAGLAGQPLELVTSRTRSRVRLHLVCITGSIQWLLHELEEHQQKSPGPSWWEVRRILRTVVDILHHTVEIQRCLVRAWRVGK